jgi:hypothetical protein
MSDALQLQFVLLRALKAVRAGDEFEARLILRQHLESIERAERLPDSAEAAGRPGTSGQGISG